MKQLNGIKGNSCLLKEEALKCKISFGLSDTICKQTATKHLTRLRNYCYIVSTIRNQFENEGNYCLFKGGSIKTPDLKSIFM